MKCGGFGRQRIGGAGAPARSAEQSLGQDAGQAEGAEAAADACGAVSRDGSIGGSTIRVTVSSQSCMSVRVALPSGSASALRFNRRKRTRWRQQHLGVLLPAASGRFAGRPAGRGTPAPSAELSLAVGRRAAVEQQERPADARRRRPASAAVRRAGEGLRLLDHELAVEDEQLLQRHGRHGRVGRW